MISDIIEIKQDSCTIDIGNTNNIYDSSNTCVDNNITNTNVLIPLSINTHEKIYNFLVDEIKEYKQSSIDKDKQISVLNNKIDELVAQLNELESKLNKMNNINLLIKLKENLTNKQNDFISEINNSENTNSNDNANTNTNSNDNANTNTNDNTNSNSNDNLSMNLSLETSKPNIVIDDSSEKTTKPKKRQNVFSRRF